MTLTPEMREYLRNAETASLPFYDLVIGFSKRFNVAPDALGRLLCQWIKETV